MNGPQTLYQVFDDRAAVDGAHPAIEFQGRTWSHAELAKSARAVAAWLAHAQGVAAGERVAWLGANHPAQIALLVALARLGAILVPLNFRLAPPEWDRLMSDCAPRLIVHDDAWADPARALAQRHGMTTLGAGELLDARGSQPHPVHEDAQAPVLIVYTSGTTGRPKGAIHTQANLVANMRIAARAQAITPHDRVATVLPMFHVGGLCIQTLPALGAGATVLLHERFTPEATFDCFERDRPTLTLQVPATMRALVEHPRWASTSVSSLRAVWAGSSALPASLVQAFHARGLPVCNVYGSTETGPFSIALPPQHAMSHVGSCGWPAPEVEVRLHDEQRGAGEVLVRAPNVVRRYWPDQDALDPDGWFHTGDLASRASDGSYTIVGRVKDLIISGGENIHPAEIEQALSEHPEVAECAAFGLPDVEWGEIVAVAVVRRPASVVDEAQLREWLGSRIARYKLPRRWLWIDTLPKTALGKVQRHALTQQALR